MRQIMEVLGHGDIENAELYPREAEQVTLAVTQKEKIKPSSLASAAAQARHERKLISQKFAGQT